MLTVTGKRVTEVTFAVLPVPLFLFFRMSVMGQAARRARSSELGVRRPRISPYDLPLWVCVPICGRKLDSISVFSNYGTNPCQRYTANI